MASLRLGRADPCSHYAARRHVCEPGGRSKAGWGQPQGTGHEQPEDCRRQHRTIFRGIKGRDYSATAIRQALAVDTPPNLDPLNSPSLAPRLIPTEMG